MKNDTSMEVTKDEAAAAAFDPNLSIDKNCTMQTAETEFTDSTFSSFQDSPLRFQTPTQPSVERALQTIPPHDVLLSSRWAYRTRANVVYDNIVCPKRTKRLDVAKVKKDLRVALMNEEAFRNEYGFRKIPLPKFWLPADKVEDDPSHAWKGKFGTERTFLVGKKKQMKVYEASDAWIVEENHGNSNRKAASRRKGDVTDKQSMEAFAAELHDMSLSDGDDERKAVRPNSLKRVERATRQVLAEGGEWAKDSKCKLFCYTAFAKDISRIQEWSRSIDSYGRWDEDIRAAHCRQLEVRLVQLVEDLVGDMKSLARLGETRVKVPQPNDGFSDRPANQSRTERDAFRNVGINPSVPPYSCQSNKQKEYVDRHTGGGFFPPAPPPSYLAGAATEQVDCRIDGGFESWTDRGNDEALFPPESKACQESSFRTHGHDIDMRSPQTSSPDARTAFDFLLANSPTCVQDHKRKASTSDSEHDGLGLSSATKREAGSLPKYPSKPPLKKTHPIAHEKKGSVHGMLDKQEEARHHEGAAFSGSDTSFKSFFDLFDDPMMDGDLTDFMATDEGCINTDCVGESRIEL